MELANKEHAVMQLERGLGEVHWIAAGFDPSLRLRMALCGITSVALAEKFVENDYDVELIISSPAVPHAPEAQHVMPLVRHQGRNLIVDATYSQFMEYSGLTPGYVTFGGRDMYPREKIRVMMQGESDKVATDLYIASRYFLEHRQPMPEIDWKRNAFDNVSENDQKKTWASIWNEENFDTFIPDEQTLEAGRKLAKFITAEHVRLVD